MSIKKEFSKNVLDKIKKNDIKPRPRWQFLLKDCVVWSVGVLALVIGGLSFSVIKYLFSSDDWSGYSQVEGGVLGVVLLTLPYFWLVTLFIFIFIVYYNIKHTKRGYKYSLGLVLPVSVVASMLLGAVFFELGFGEAIDDVLSEKAPLYSEVFNPRFNYWHKPNEGRLVGMVIAVKSDREFSILDLKKSKWRVYGESRKVEVGRPVRLIGRQIEKNEFMAREFMLIGSGKEFFRRHRECCGPDFEEVMRRRELMRSGKDFDIGKESKDISIIFKKYPLLKKSLEEGLLNNKEELKKMLEGDVDFEMFLKRSGIELGVE